jgi:murein L,D-transpeptidase YcbB/YkuD
MALNLVTGNWASASIYDEGLDVELRIKLKQKIEQEQRRERFTCRNEMICGTADLPFFYARREYRPAWVSQRSLATAKSLMRSIRVADLDGLRTADYHTAEIDMLIKKVTANRLNGTMTPPDILADLDILLTDSFLLLGSHMMAGRVNPETIHTAWTVYHPEANLTQTLETAIESDQIEFALNRLKPPHHGYRALKSALNRYREIAAFGGWPILDKKLSWEKGEGGTHIALLRERLGSTGDLDFSDESSGNRSLYNDILETGIARFQARHGLPETGMIDEATIEALNVPVDVRIRQIELNLERWRWIPHDLGSRYLLVNIADYNLTVFEDSLPKWGMRVVVGRDYRRTPVFSADIKYLVINPYWNIPRKIAVNDILPKVQRDPEYLIKKRIKVFASWQEDAPELNPYAVDWSQVTKRNFTFKFRKDPGPFNDLGRIKFMLPNKYAVYLHDTPSRKLFKRNTRSFSSGCIRLERPLDLADYLLKDDPDWSRRDLIRAIESGKGNKVVRLAKPIPVHLLYWTAWVDSQGKVNFRKDIYNRDPQLDVALKERPPDINAVKRTLRDHLHAKQLSVEKKVVYPVQAEKTQQADTTSF